MKRKYKLWLTPLLNGGVQIIIHESNLTDAGFVNHRFQFEEDDMTPSTIASLRKAP